MDTAVRTVVAALAVLTAMAGWVAEVEPRAGGRLELPLARTGQRPVAYASDWTRRDGRGAGGERPALHGRRTAGERRGDLERADTNWSVPRRLCDGFLKNKPTVLRDGRWLLPVEFMNIGPAVGRLGKMSPMTGPEAHPMPEMMAADVFESRDCGRTWTGVKPSKIQNPRSRFFVGRIRSGALLLVKIVSAEGDRPS